jgi:hypothetical protein
MGVSFDSEESFEIEREMFRVIYHTAMSTSIDLAVKFGKYDSFEGSPPSEGLPNQIYGRIPTSRGTAPSSHPPTGKISVLSRLMEHAIFSPNGSDAHGFYLHSGSGAEAMEPYSAPCTLGRR